MAKPILIAALLVWGAARALPALGEEAPAKVTPLKLELTFSPAPDGGESGSSLTLYLLADSKRAVALRAGREVAVPAAGNQYRNVGINVTCLAAASGDGFRLDLEVERSSLVEGSDPVRPSFYTFNANSALHLRDGETVELAGGSDLQAIVAKLRVLRN